MTQPRPGHVQCPGPSEQEAAAASWSSRWLWRTSARAVSIASRVTLFLQGPIGPDDTRFFL